MEKKNRKPATINQDFEKAVQEMITERRPSPQERTRQQVHATGNKWAIENFENTHN